MAERSGFEPEVEVYPLHSLSRRAPSANSAISPHTNPNSFTAEDAENAEGFDVQIQRISALFALSAVNIFLTYLLSYSCRSDL